MPKIFTQILVLFFLFLPLSWGADIDRKQPIHVEADQMQYDTLNKINRFSGNVAASQGSLSMRSDTIEIRQDKNGYQHALATGTSQKRAFFRQNRNEQNERIEGEAHRIEYDGRTASLKLIGDAVLRRYRDDKLADQTAGGIITYNDNSGMFTVESGRNSSSPTGRVTSVFTPPPE